MSPFRSPCHDTISSVAYGIVCAALTLLLALAGCTRQHEKNFAGTSAGNLEMTYSVTLKYRGGDEAAYHLQLKPRQPERFVAALNEKWHSAGKVKFDAYNNMKRYCELTNDPAACASLKEFSQEVANPAVTAAVNLVVYDAGGAVLENINLNHSYNLDDKDNLAANAVEIGNTFRIDGKNFSRIARIALTVDL